MKQKVDVYQIITDRMIDLLEKGTIPWSKPWKTHGGLMPQNLVSKKEYRGINVFMLLCTNFNSPYWVSFKQAKDLGGMVKKGEKGFPVVFWTFFKKEDEETGKEKTIPFLRYYTVFNVEQCQGLEDKIPAMPEDEEKQPVNIIDACQAIVEGMPKKPKIDHGESQAYYRPSSDLVMMPKIEDFRSAEEYHSTLFHELIHSTGHESRLARKGIMEISFFGSCDYSKEELVAEMGASFLCAQAGILERTIENSAAYLKSWLKALKNDKKMIVYAAAQAQKASEFILGNAPSEDTKED